MYLTIVFFREVDVVDEFRIVLEKPPGQGQVSGGLHEEADVEGGLPAEPALLHHPAALAEQVRSWNERKKNVMFMRKLLLEV